MFCGDLLPQLGTYEELHRLDLTCPELHLGLGRLGGRRGTREDDVGDTHGHGYLTVHVVDEWYEVYTGVVVTTDALDGDEPGYEDVVLGGVYHLVQETVHERLDELG